MRLCDNLLNFMLNAEIYSKRKSAAAIISIHKQNLVQTYCLGERTSNWSGCMWGVRGRGVFQEFSSQ